MFKRLSVPTGEIADSNSTRPEDTPEKIVRSAILVHSAADGEEVTLSASNGEVSFDEARIKSVVENHNKMIAQLAVQYGGFDKMPIGAYPPILDQHADDSNDRIRGRLTGLLRFERRSVPKVGSNVACAICDITFLGADTVSQVLDGRIYHLSVGIDEGTDTLGETSTVIEPAAPGAMVLRKKLESGIVATEKYKGKIIKVTALKPNGLMTRYQWDCPDADVPDDKEMYQAKSQAMAVAKYKIDALVARSLKKGVPRMSKEKFAKLKKLTGELKKLSAKAGEQKTRVTLAKRKNEVTSRFTKLMQSKKMTPAEFKKLDVTRLAKLDKESLESVMHVYEGREALVKTGQQGSTSAANFSDVANTEEREYKRLKLAARKNLEKKGIKFKASDDEDEKELSQVEDDKKDLSLEDAGIEGAPVEESGDDAQEKEEMMQQIEENATQIARVASMVESIIEEMGNGDDENADDQESEEPAEAAKSDDDDKELSDDKDDEDKDKKDKKDKKDDEEKGDK